MIYKHNNFQLNTDSRKVFDESGKELRLTGNSYRLLVFLCEKKNANITEIGDYLDHAKDYNEDHIRQYRYKVNNIVGKDVIGYKNGIYSLIGDLEKADKIRVSDRNTVLLHPDSVGFWCNMKNKIKFSKNPAIIVSILLLLSFFAWSYGYYTLLRWAVSVVAIYYAWYLFVEKQCLQEKSDFEEKEGEREKVVPQASERKRSFLEEERSDGKGAHHKGTSYASSSLRSQEDNVALKSERVVLVSDNWFWSLLAIAILFNPIAPIYLGSKIIWNIVDVVVAGVFIGLIVKING